MAAQEGALVIRAIQNLLNFEAWASFTFCSRLVQSGLYMPREGSEFLPNYTSCLNFRFGTGM